MVFSKRLISAGVPPSWARMLGLNAEDNITATGATQGTAYQLTQSINRIAGGGLNTGVVLPAAAKDITNFSTVQNGTATTKLVYPNVGEEFNAIGPNNPITVLASNSITLYRVSDTRWITA